MAQVRLLLVLERTFLGFTQGLCLVGMLRDVQGPRRATRLAAVDLRPSTGGGRLAAVDWRPSTGGRRLAAVDFLPTASRDPGLDF